MHVLVATARYIDQDDILRPAISSQAGGQVDRVGRLQCRNDPLGPAEEFEAIERLLIGDRVIGRPTAVLQIAMFRPDTGVIKTGRYTMRVQNLAIRVLEYIGP